MNDKRRGPVIPFHSSIPQSFASFHSHPPPPPTPVSVFDVFLKSQGGSPHFLAGYKAALCTEARRLCVCVCVCAGRGQWYRPCTPPGSLHPPKIHHCCPPSKLGVRWHPVSSPALPHRPSPGPRAEGQESALLGADWGS